MKTGTTKKSIFGLLCFGAVIISGQTYAAPTQHITNEGEVQMMQSNAAAYWTEQRMANANPVAMPEMKGDPQNVSILGNEARPNAEGEAGQADGMEGDLSSVLLSGDEASAIALTGAIDLQTDDIQLLATAYVPIGWYGYHPWRTVGKVFFSQGFGNYVCSGSSVGGRAVLTAGHCVSNGAGTWSSNFLFVPRYLVGTAPDGVWSAPLLSTFTAWHLNSNLCRDVGFAITNNQGGLTLSQKVGYLGFAWNYGLYQWFNMFGYPAASPFTGEYMVHTDSWTVATANPNGCTPTVKGILTSQTGGTSGGPWLLNYSPFVSGAVNHANGVNSFIYTSNPSVLYSPHFDTAVNDFRVWAVAQ